MIRTISSALLCLALFGCASSGRIGELPAVPAGGASSPLVLVRPSSIVGAANSYYVALDGKDVFSIGSGEHTQFPVSTGEHVVAVKCFGGWSPTWKEDGKKFVAADGQASYFEINPNMRCAKITQVSAETGKPLVAATKFIDPSKSSDK